MEEEYEMEIEDSGGVGAEVRNSEEDPKESISKPMSLREAAALREANASQLPPESQIDPTVQGQVVEVKFVVLPEGFVHFLYVPPSVTTLYLLNLLSRDLRVDVRSMKIRWRSRELADDDVLSDSVELSQDGPTSLNLELQYMPRHLAVLQKYDNVAYVFPVQIHYGDGIPPKVITVTVVKAYHHKQFIGGFRNKKSRIEYHHGIAQTDPLKKEPRPKPPCFSRVTQTPGISRSQQSKREAWTQMARPGLEIDTSEDRIYKARKYFSAHQLHRLRVAKVIVIQAHVRGWFARRLARRMREEELQRRDDRRKEQIKRQKEYEEKRQKEIERRMHPRTQADFNVLYNELEAWRLQESEKIQSSTMTPEEKKLARQELLKKETRLLQTIDRLQIKANTENKKEKTKSQLSSMAAHKVWKHSNAELGHTVVETPFTVRAKELLDLYNGLQLRGLTVDERLDILLHVKWTVKEFECALTREMVELIDREADLLNRGRKEKSLEGLRTRMSNLFLQFCETPEFNPEAINHQRVPLEFTTRPLVKLDATKR